MEHTWNAPSFEPQNCNSAEKHINIALRTPFILRDPQKLCWHRIMLYKGLRFLGLYHIIIIILWIIQYTALEVFKPAVGTRMGTGPVTWRNPELDIFVFDSIRFHNL